MFLRLCMVFCGLLFVCALASAQQIVVEKESPLYSAPRTDASVVARLKEGTPGESLARKGAWVNVKTAAGTGWMQTFNVRFLAPGATQPSASAPRPKSKITATIGIRGLDAEDLRNARYDEQQINLLDHSMRRARRTRKARPRRRA